MRYDIIVMSLLLQPPQLSKKEIEDLLRKGAYGAIMEEDDDANKSVLRLSKSHSNAAVFIPHHPLCL